MTLLLLHALVLATAAMATAASENDTAGGNATTAAVLCNGAGCGPPPSQPLPIYTGPPPSQPLPIYTGPPPSQPLPIYTGPPPSPPTPASPGTQAPCPPVPVPVVCCGGQNMPPQPYYQAPPTGYLPYYNSTASAPLVLRPAAVSYYVTALCLVWWAVV